MSSGLRVSGAGSSHRSRKTVSTSSTAGPRTATWTSCHGGRAPYTAAIGCRCGSPRCSASSRRLWHRSMPPTKATSSSGRPGMPQHHELLVVRAARTHPHVAQAFAAGRVDLLAEMPILLLAEGEPVQMRAPDQSLDDDPALGGRGEARRDTAVSGPPAADRIAAPVGEQQQVAGVLASHRCSSRESSAPWISGWTQVARGPGQAVGVPRSRPVPGCPVPPPSRTSQPTPPVSPVCRLSVPGPPPANVGPNTNNSVTSCQMISSHAA